MLVKFQFFLKQLDFFFQRLNGVTGNEVRALGQYMKYFISGELWFDFHILKKFYLGKE